MSKNHHLKTKMGFTTIELIITTLIMLPVLVSVMYVFLRCMELNELSRNTSQAIWGVRNQMSAIDNTPFNQVNANYDNVTFVVNGLTGIGVNYVDDTQPDTLDVTTTFCWREKNGRVIGEDSDLDGQIDAGEDVNANGVLDSPVMMRTIFYDV